jgi:hypothetical protein
MQYICVQLTINCTQGQSDNTEEKNGCVDGAL